MRKLITLLLLLALAGFGLPGCGGGGGGDTAPSQALQDVINAGTPPPTPPPVDPGLPPTNPVTVSAIQMTTSSSTIGTGQTANLTLTLFDASGQLVAESKQVTK